MTQREEVRFKVYTKSSIDIFGNFPLELIDFLEGDGTYDTTTLNTPSKTQGLIYWVYLIINEETLITEWLIW